MQSCVYSFPDLGQNVNEDIKLAATGGSTHSNPLMLNMEKLRHREGRRLGQSQTASSRQSQALSPELQCSFQGSTVGQGTLSATVPAQQHSSCARCCFLSPHSAPGVDGTGTCSNETLSDASGSVLVGVCGVFVD